MLIVRGHEEPIGRFIDRHAFFGLFLYLSLNIIDALVVPGARRFRSFQSRRACGDARRRPLRPQRDGPPVH